MFLAFNFFFFFCSRILSWEFVRGKVILYLSVIKMKKIEMEVMQETFQVRYYHFLKFLFTPSSEETIEIWVQDKIQENEKYTEVGQNHASFSLNEKIKKKRRII